MPIHPLPVMLEEEEERKAIERLKPPASIVCRYGYMKLIGEFPYSGDEIPGCGTKLVIRTDRGTELAEMLTTTCTNSGCGSSITRKQMLDYIQQSGGKEYPFSENGKVIRLASVDDVRDQSRLDAEKPRFVQACRSAIRRLNLPMKLVDVERLLGGERVIFYFTADGRVDFRELVRELASEFHTRIEMCQVGARDEARLVADYEKCGQHCCCKQFLKVLKPVSMKSAKIQKATLDPTKISGRCGRLMCCLRYEDVTYADLRKRLPNRNATVMTEDGPGRVVNTQILTQLVLVELEATGQRQAYPVENIEQMSRQQIEARKKEMAEAAEQKRQADQSRRAADNRGPRRPKPGKPLRDEETESREGEQASTLDNPPAEQESQQQSSGGKPKRRRRRRGRKSGGQNKGNEQASTDGNTSGGGDGSSGGKSKRRRRGRGRRRRKGGNNGGDSGGNNSDSGS
jgi:cell fate regulator YaaT (PSP1 superfamily)